MIAHDHEHPHPCRPPRRAGDPRRLRLSRRRAGQRDHACANAELGPAARELPAFVDRRVRAGCRDFPKVRWETPRWDISTSALDASSTRTTRASTMRSRPASSRRTRRSPAAVAAAKAAGSAVHVLGLLSPGGVHSHERQIAAMVDLAAAGGAPRIVVHAFLDGRDTPPRSAAASLDFMTEVCREHRATRIASICGRYYAMDRDKRWERVAVAYDLLVDGSAPFRRRLAAGRARRCLRARGDRRVRAAHGDRRGRRAASDDERR